jgi:putative membrane protein
MFAEFLLFCGFGAACGAATGLIPGLHSNTVSAAIISLNSTLFSAFPVHLIASMIMSMLVTHTFFNFISCVFIGVPEAGTSLSVLPGHRMAMAGRGYEAVFLMSLGGLGAMASFVLFFPAALFVVPALYAAVKPFTGWLLAGMLAYMVLSERRRVWALVSVVLSGALGLVVLGPISMPEQSLFPLFAGLFGLCTLITGSRGNFPAQAAVRECVGKATAVVGTVKGFFSGMVMGVLPGLGTAQACTLASHIGGSDEKRFMISIGSVNVSVALFSVISLYFFSRARSGVAVAIQSLSGGLVLGDVLVLVFAAAFASCVSFPMALGAARAYGRLMEMVDYKNIAASVIVFIVFMVFLLAGPAGLLIFAAAAATGLVPVYAGVRRTTLMSSLILPVCVWHFGLVF